ncbi:MAG: helix-turn-helix transcriptional regulator [Treponema sp.]|uniref:helix-turn-helix domain-containing protein n=1 Tax=Treponema sp. TaxID=166 RepID=UPI00298E4CB7|nr:helix-turn-helix transcriptional regulator [Treponema sp.]MCQ2601868.1 helix-turn-helix transcriptional regulator [Treponema sp.]
MDVLEKIRQYRNERNWTEYQLAEKSGLPQSTISSWYRKNQIPTIPSLEKICNAFNITLSQFFLDDVNENAVLLNERQKDFLHEINRISIEQQDIIIKLIKSIK